MIDQLRAYFAWAHLSEPADEVAKDLVRNLGAVEAWEWLVSGSQSAPHGVEDAAKLLSRVQPWRARLDIPFAKLWDRWTREGHRFITPIDPEWPFANSRALENPPFGIWFVGSEQIWDHMQQTCALVGSRAASRYGLQATAYLTSGIVEQGVTTISGGAFGIDVACHQTTVAEGGRTISVQAGGLDRLYPETNRELFEKITVSGALISQIAPGGRPTRWRFLDRNRLIAALADATIVTEAAVRSGALNTARHAFEMGHEVGAVPGPINLPYSVGSNNLLRDGAQCITTPEDILELLGNQITASAPKGFHSTKQTLLDDLPERESRVLDAFPKKKGTTLENLSRISAISPSEVQAALGMLEMAGKIARQGQLWMRKW
ncbi:MAG: DNA-processing protein DprA [Actinomycetaceae bacterium]|nr:DNA-processing protein DprA [Actinomycetaceae bacterium]